VVTPYIDSLNERIKASLEADSLEVALIAGLGIDYNFAIADVKPDKIISFVVKTIAGQKIDGIFISCTNFRGMEVRGRIEQLTGLPVVTSNQAVLEHALKVLGQA
jgi:maleate isomerase